MQLRALKSESMETYKEVIHSTWGTSLMRYYLKFPSTAAEVKSEATTVPICKLANTKLYRIKRCSCYHTSDNHNQCSRWELTTHGLEDLVKPARHWIHCRWITSFGYSWLQAIVNI